MSQRACPACGADESLKCDGCDARACLDCLTYRADELLCWECIKPPRCRESGCSRPMERYSGMCRVHHPLWLAQFDRMATS